MSLDKGTEPTTLASLSQKIEAVKEARKEVEKPITVSGDAARAAIDFASATAVGCALGYALDLWLGLSPWCMIAGLFIGCAAGAKLMLDGEARADRKAKREEAKKQKTNI